MNTIGYTFNAPVHADQNTYIAKLDYNVDSSGKNRLFWRGNLQNDSADGTPQFQGAQPNSVTLVNNKGLAAGWTSVLTPSMVSSLHYGFTRAGGETTGILTSPYVSFRGFDTISGTNDGNVAHRSGAQRLRGSFVEQGRARSALRRPGALRLRTAR